MAAKRNYWPDSSRPNWCPCVEGDPHLCKPELHPTSPVHGTGARSGGSSSRPPRGEG